MKIVFGEMGKTLLKYDPLGQVLLPVCFPGTEIMVIVSHLVTCRTGGTFVISILDAPFSWSISLAFAVALACKKGDGSCAGDASDVGVK